ncbi:hypothetical protein GIB67_015258 [Kingdonia uniflora]|uniref:Arp2/3 complex 34 kDa subunit n=1 Tax=Kingdonia uniflora TaxID=39325 RepID=A0A7J7MT07_9MAGN|nr:hypothetical protein GIB67_015258 [Kingdonia uniflora]
MRSPEFILLSISLPAPPPETIFFGGLPSGVLEAIKEAYGVLGQILDSPKDGYNLTMKLNLEKLPQDEEEEYDLLVKIASLKEVVLGAPLRVVLKHLAFYKVATDVDQLVAIEFVEARLTAGLNTPPPCLLFPSPPLKLKGAPSHALTANAGFVTIRRFPN